MMSSEKIKRYKREVFFTWELACSPVEVEEKITALESELKKVKAERDRAVELIEKLVHPQLLCDTNLYKLVSEGDEFLQSLNNEKEEKK